MSEQERTKEAKAPSNLNSRSEAAQPPFSYFESSFASGSDFVNSSTATWIVVIGIGVTGSFTISTAGGNVKINVLNSALQVIDTIFLNNDQFGSPTSGWETHLFILSKKLLIPPGGHLSGSATYFFQGLQGPFNQIIEFIK